VLRPADKVVEEIDQVRETMLPILKTKNDILDRKPNNSLLPVHIASAVIGTTVGLTMHCTTKNNLDDYVKGGGDNAYVATTLDIFDKWNLTINTCAGLISGLSVAYLLKKVYYTPYNRTQLIVEAIHSKIVPTLDEVVATRDVTVIEEVVELQEIVDKNGNVNTKKNRVHRTRKTKHIAVELAEYLRRYCHAGVAAKTAILWPIACDWLENCDVQYTARYKIFLVAIQMLTLDQDETQILDAFEKRIKSSEF
jgi:hypothetical protein